MGDVVVARIGDDIVGDTPPGARHGDGFAPEPVGEAQRVGDAVALDVAERQTAPALDRKRDPGRAQTIGEALGVADEPRAARVLADAHHDPLACSPGPRDGMGLHMREELVVDALRGAAQRELPQGREIAGREEVLQGALGLMGQVDLALAQALQEVVGRDVDDLDVVGLIEDRVRHRLAHPDARDLGHHVVEALDVLDVQGRVDVDAGRQHLLDVLVALRVAAARRIGVGEFVDRGRSAGGAR